jgi:hypothetical protein
MNRVRRLAFLAGEVRQVETVFAALRPAHFQRTGCQALLNPEWGVKLMKTLETLFASDTARQRPAAPAGRLLTMALTVAAALVPALAAAQAQDLNNPLNRNPRNRSGIADSAPVFQDPRNSSTRPTQPAAPRKPDSRDTVPAPDPSRDVAPTALGGIPQATVQRF